MRNGDKKWFCTKFEETNAKLVELNKKMDAHSTRIAVLETKWNMTWKFVTVISGTIALAMTSILKLIWR